MAVSPFSEWSVSPSLPWGATVTPPCPRLCCLSPGWWCRGACPAQCRNSLEASWTQDYMQHATCTIQWCLCLCSKDPFPGIEALAQMIADAYFLFPSQLVHDPPACPCPVPVSPYASAPHLYLLISVSRQSPAASFNPSFPFYFESPLSASPHDASPRSVSTPAPKPPPLPILNFEAPTSWWKPCYKFILRMKLYFSA